MVQEVFLHRAPKTYRLKNQFSYDGVLSKAEGTKFCPNNSYDIHVMDRHATIVVIVSFSLH